MTEVKPKNDIEYVMRVNLPSSAAFHSGPSGDTDYSEAYSKAIREALPVGFEVSWSSQSTWPKDKDGMTWVKLYCADSNKAMQHWREMAMQYKKKLENAIDLASQITAV